MKMQRLKFTLDLMSSMSRIARLSSKRSKRKSNAMRIRAWLPHHVLLVAKRKRIQKATAQANCQSCVNNPQIRLESTCRRNPSVHGENVVHNAFVKFFDIFVKVFEVFATLAKLSNLFGLVRTISDHPPDLFGPVRTISDLPSDLSGPV